MKTLFLFLFSAIILSASAQETECKYSINEVDEFTGDVKKSTKEKYIGAGKYGKLTASVARIGDITALYLRYTSDLGCAGSSAYAILKFTDGSTTTVKHIGKIDCGDYPLFAANITMEKDSLLLKQIDKIRFALSKSYADTEISEKNFLITNLKCVE